jgi:hypothetical protein
MNRESNNMTMFAPAESRNPNEKALQCPSAQPAMRDSKVLGVVGGSVTAPEVLYLDESLPVTEELLSTAAPVQPTEVFRFSAKCDEEACRHYDAGRCKLATRVVRILPAVTDNLPKCVIRPTCRWYRQEGRAACLRCPQVVTLQYDFSDDSRRVAEGE